MPDQRLIDYIKQELQKGFSLDGIKRNLLQYNYTPQQIQEAIDGLQVKGQPQDLKSFIAQQLKQGYPLKSVQQYLTQQGYSQQDITNATNAVYNQQGPQPQQPKKVRKPLNLKPIIITLFILLIIAVAAFGVYYFINKAPATTEGAFSYTLSIDQKSVKPGETLYFSNNFINMPSKRKDDIIIKYTIIEQLTNKQLDQWEEKMTKSSIPKRNIKYIVPLSTTPGAYSVQADLTYGKTQTKVTAAFNVIIETVEATCFDGKLNQNEEQTDCGGDCNPCLDVSEEIVEVVPLVAITPQATQQDREFKVDALDALTPDVSINFCNKIGNAYERNQCFNQVAQKFQQSRICEEIKGNDPNAITIRDSCYFNFVTQNKYENCPMIQGEQLQDICASLQLIQNVQTAAGSGDPNAVGELIGFRIE